MNRKVFLKNAALLGVGLTALPNLVSAHSLGHSKSANHFSNGFEPIIRETPWGQKVFFDRYTYTDMHRAKWRLEGFSYAEIEDKIKNLEAQIENGDIELRKGPSLLLKGLWLIDVDGQQNTYLIQTVNGLILVDPGMTSTSNIVIDQLEELGFRKEEVKYILLTHCHVDHAQSANYWEELGAKIYIHNEEVNAIQTGNELTAWWLNGKEEDRKFPAVKKAIPFYDGDRLDIGEHRIFICHTPGHTPGSSCFFLKIEDKNILISGDTIFHNGKHGWMGHPYANYEDYISSLWKLRRFAVEGKVHNEPDRIMVREPVTFDMLLPGHTAISYSDVQRDIDKGIEIMSYTIQQRRKGNDYQWTEPYSFFAEREVQELERIQIEYR